MGEVVEKKSVVQHVLFSGLGGHGSVFFSLVEADEAKEFDFRAIFCGVEEMTNDYKVNCEKLEVPFDYLKKKNGIYIPGFFKLFHLFRKNRPNTIFLHGVTFSIISAFWYKITRPRTRILVRDTQAHHLKTKSEWFWMFFCILFSKKIVVLTQASADGLKKKFGWIIGRKKMIIIPNGLSMIKYQPLKKQEVPGRFIFGMQSRLQPIKDHPTLIKAFEKLSKKYPSYTLELHIAGDGETMPAIRQLVDGSRMQDKIKLHGMLQEKELRAFMQSLDIYVHATFGETLSNSIMQAMASGLPVIASDVWGVNNMIRNGESGLLYESENVEQLASLMEILVTDAARRADLGIAARDHALGEYSNQKMFERYRGITTPS